MASFGGDISEITFNHDTIGSGIFTPKAGEGNTFDPGGIRNSDDSNGVSGDGEMIIIKNRVRAGFEITVANDMNIRNDVAKIAELAASPDLAEYTVSMLNGTVWSGFGIPVGDIVPDTNAATVSLKIASGGFKKIVG